jgi:hypothetical protein
LLTGDQTLTDATIGPEPPARPFNRAEHCRRIGAHGGTANVARHGTHHMRVIGTAGAYAPIRKDGIAFFQGIITAKGWHGRRRLSSAVALAAGAVDVAFAASRPEGWPDHPARAHLTQGRDTPMLPPSPVPGWQGRRPHRDHA